MKKLLLSLLILFSLSPNLSSNAISIVPEVNENFRSNFSCTIIMKEFEQLYDFGYKSATTLISEMNGDINNAEDENRVNQFIANDNANAKFACATKDLNNYLSTENWQPKACDPRVADESTDFTENDILGCSIITGRIRFAYLPRFIVYSLELLTILSGALSLLFVILGGYFYLINSLSGEDVEKGKSYIKNAVIGLIVSLSAWSIINLVQLFFTS